jgi:alanine racemase
MIRTSYSANEIASILDGEHLLMTPNSLISNLIIDRKKGANLANSLFVALIGDFRNGHHFIDEMYQNGVRNFLVSEPIEDLPNANIFHADNTVEALQTLANFQRDNSPVPNQNFYHNAQMFLEHIRLFDFYNEGILIKAEQKFQFEQITTKLEQKTRQTQLEINLNALKHNFNFYRNKIEKGVKMMVMVKANGYGAGGVEVAQVLAAQDVDYLGVAYADEGVSIRKSGVTTPIMVMNASEEVLPTMVHYDLEPEIYSLELLKAYTQVLDKTGSSKSRYKIHLKIDTGMNRLGFKLDEIDAVLEFLKKEKHVKVASVFSHLAASDDCTHDDFTQSQIQMFADVSQKIELALGYAFIKHIANSAAIERFESAQFDMVRLGIGLYGMANQSGFENQLKTVSSLYSIVVQTKNVKKGESIGYGRSFFANNDMRIAIIPIGYADGINRSLGNGKGAVFIDGQKRPIVGKICMDIIMVDVTDLSIQVNDEVEIFGENISVLEIASSMDTISYEILTSIPSRVNRVYINRGL